ncbi:MAG: class I SAM-dependent RNA methyltransferase [Rhodomicrobiaceae bacterium]
MEITIKALGPRGDGYYESDKETNSKKDEFRTNRIYVDRSVPGDKLEVKTRRNKEGGIQGEIVKIIEPSKDRVKAPCPSYNVCGGCTLQHVSEAFYKTWKQELIIEALKRQSLEPKEVLEPIYIGEGSRRRVTFSAFKQRDKVILGYKKRRSKMINDIENCLIADPELMKLQPILKKHLADCLQAGRVVDVLIQKINGVFDVVLTGEVGKKGNPDLSVMQMAADLIQDTKIARLSWREKFHDECDVIVEKEPIKIQFGKLEIKLPPASFLQPTEAGEAELIKAVVNLLPKEGRCADLFCGCGTFTGPMLKNLKKGAVDAFETIQSAVDALNKEAKFKGLPLNAIERDLFKLPLNLDELNKYEALVFDPPRAGAKKQVALLANSTIKTIIAVSCNPITFARDARVLTEGGYEFESIQLIDQFTQSHHVEMVGAFRKDV